jgi:Mismatch repair ATPase (MutS family)
MSQTPATYYIKLLQQTLQEEKKLSRTSRALSVSRLLSIVTGLVFVIVFFKQVNNLWLFLAVASLIVFIVLISIHAKVIERLTYYRNKIHVIQNELDCMDLEPKLYSDGKIFKEKMPYADDLDLFGNHSVFHLLNRCSTEGGLKTLAKSLLHNETDSALILKKQEAIKELSEANDFYLNTLTQLLATKDKATERRISCEECKKNSNFSLLSLVIFPILMAASIAVFISTGNYLAFVILGMIGILTAAFKSKATTKLSRELDGLKNTFEIYSMVMEDFCNLTIRCEILKEMQKTAKESIIAFNQLAKISHHFDNRNNIIWLFLSNFLFMNDLIISMQFIHWKINHSEHLDKWIENISNLETLMSFAGFAHNNPEYTNPSLSTSLKLEGKQIRHPLIPESKNISNDIKLSDNPRFMLITGSNMSGKSTWLRTIGVNVILAQAGSVVAAESLCIKPMRVLSSLRQSDSLLENTSLFMNELKQLKRILDEVQKGQSCLVLLDEVLRGTNSDDKYIGSRTLAEKMSQFESITIMATHDLKLQELEFEHPNRFTNYCFESKVENGKLVFDYTIRKGVAINRNATWLMKDMGII